MKHPVLYIIFWRIQKKIQVSKHGTETGKCRKAVAPHGRDSVASEHTGIGSHICITFCFSFSFLSNHGEQLAFLKPGYYTVT